MDNVQSNVLDTRFEVNNTAILVGSAVQSSGSIKGNSFERNFIDMLVWAADGFTILNNSMTGTVGPRVLDAFLYAPTAYPTTIPAGVTQLTLSFFGQQQSEIDRALAANSFVFSFSNWSLFAPRTQIVGAPVNNGDGTYTITLSLPTVQAAVAGNKQNFYTDPEVYSYTQAAFSTTWADGVTTDMFCGAGLWVKGSISGALISGNSVGKYAGVGGYLFESGQENKAVVFEGNLCSEMLGQKYKFPFLSYAPWHSRVNWKIGANSKMSPADTTSMLWDTDFTLGAGWNVWERIEFNATVPRHLFLMNDGNFNPDDTGYYGWETTIIQMGAGQVIVQDGTWGPNNIPFGTVVLSAVGSKPKTRQQYSEMKLKHVGLNTWMVSGDIVAS